MGTHQGARVCVCVCVNKEVNVTLKIFRIGKDSKKETREKMGLCLCRSLVSKGMWLSIHIQSLW